jgi:high-affinity Fe2+/Pb2+ permease
MSLAPPAEAFWLLAAKFAGAVLGSAISLAYVLPKGRREAALRFFTGVAAGMVFGAAAGLKIAEYLGVSGELSRLEITMTGAAAASLCAWWGLGVLARLADRIARPQA